ncbi:MAG: hypothetical protein WCQ52_04400 [Actinomycetes bacterium]|jgi:mycothiol system anti-sigma-R factor
MSCGESHTTPCNEVLHSLVLFIDHEIQDQDQIQQIEIHFEECPPCNEELVHEKSVLGKLKSLLASSCCEEAPESLTEKIYVQTGQLAQEMQSQFFGMPSALSTHVVTQYSRTEFSVDGVETRIEIETTEITHHFEVDEE